MTRILSGLFSRAVTAFEESAGSVGNVKPVTPLNMFLQLSIGRMHGFSSMSVCSRKKFFMISVGPDQLPVYYWIEK